MFENFIRRKKLHVLSLLFLLLFAGCSEEKKQTSVSSKPYDGKSIIVIVPTLHADLIRGPIIDEAKKFEKDTGARIRVVTPGWNETIEKTKKSLNDPNLNYDIFVVISMWTGTLLQNQNVEPVPQWVKEKINWDDVLPIYKNSVLSYNNITYGMPYDGDCINLYYRKDIFENPSIQKKFKDSTQKDLSIPKTWDEYKQIAKFFNGWDWDGDGKKEYGNALLRKKGDIAMLQFFATAAAYAKHPQDKAYFFDPKTMKPRIDSPAFVEALKDYIELVEYAPPGVVNYAGHDVRNSFVTGEVAMALDWADLGIYAAENDISILKNNQVGYAQIPGSDKVYNSQTDKWEDKYNQVSSISGSWSFFVNKDSKNKKLAFDFAAFMTSKEMTTKYVSISGNAVNPSRYSHFKDYDSWTKSGFSKESAKRYLDEISKSLTNENMVYDITLPGAGLYYQALDRYVYEALKGNLSPQQALRQAAKSWDEITDEIGREAQIKYYKESLNL
jgi:multiple sugar transport system substrate-binding protein